MKNPEYKCFICLKPATKEISINLDTSDGGKQELNYLCPRHLIEYDHIRKKNKGQNSI